MSRRGTAPPRTRGLTTAAAVFIAATLGTAGCGGPASDEQAHPNRPARAHVEITAAGYRPRHIEVPVGTRVIWENRGAPPQSVETWHTAKNPFDLHTLRDGERRSHTFRSPGLYRYFSSWDGRYKGTIRVIVRRSDAPDAGR